MRHIVAPLVVLALLIAPCIADLLTRRADACAVAPCCIGKTSKSCPMHPQKQGKGMRSCGSDEHLAVAHQVVAILGIELHETRPASQPALPRNLATPSYPATPAPDPPPPRTS